MPIIRQHLPFVHGIKTGRGPGKNFLDRLWRNTGSAIRTFLSQTLAPLAGRLLQRGLLTGANRLGIPQDYSADLVAGLTSDDITGGLAETVGDEIDSLFKRRKERRQTAKRRARRREEPEEEQDIYDIDEDFNPPRRERLSGPPPPDDIPDPPNPSEEQKRLIEARKKHLGYGLDKRKKEMLKKLINDSPLYGKGIRVIK